ncbi:MAG TPA: GDP-L-fucose synthase [Deltaproteobacteria bacterium]|nr:MAG: GDP-fucose synthetase [Deltaproteobacteria bacterium]HDM75215.1 GDP-L-fucose synthase [Deltaproteobacteria bacterium]
MEQNSKIYVAGHRGLVGSAIAGKLRASGYNNLVTRTSKELDLRLQADVNSFFEQERPDYVFLAAAKVGGILANNTYPAEFLYDNLMIQSNIIHYAYVCGVKKLLFLGSSCIYPKLSPQPMKEEYLLDGKLESTNEPYAIAKIAGIKMCQSYNRQYGTNFISIMPTNLYGPNDNFDLETSHALPALLRKFHEAKMNKEPFVKIWGTGSPRREFLYVDDLADACVFLMQNYDEDQIINVGTGEDISIRELALLIKEITGYEGELKFDVSKPDGTPRKLLDVSKLTDLGWEAKTGLRGGITKTYQWYKETVY